MTVVVLGILIAFQLDEWRSRLDETEEVASSLRSVLLDLEDERESLDAFVLRLSDQFQSSSNLLRHIRDSNEIDRAIIATNYLSARRTWLWEPYSTAFTNMRELGTFELITDRELQLALYDHYGWMGYIQIQIDRHRERGTRFVGSAIDDFYLAIDENTGDTTIAFVEPLNLIPRNPSFIGALGEFNHSTSNLKLRLEQTIDRNAAIQSSIRSFLDRN